METKVLCFASFKIPREDIHGLLSALDDHYR